MPQTKLKAYFAPLPLPLCNDSQTHGLTTQPTSLLPPPEGECVDEEQKIEKSSTDPTSQPTSLREFADSKKTMTVSLDFFAPPGQPKAAIVKVILPYLPRLKNITSTLLPVRYPDKFFNECLEDEVVADLSRVLLWNSQPVGWIRCYLENNEHGYKQFYIQALGLLAPYRGCGLATHLLEQIIQPGLLQKYGPTSIYCHVWESNEDALLWYHHRGFKRVILVEQYYRRLRPAGAWIMRRELT